MAGHRGRSDRSVIEHRSAAGRAVVAALLLAALAWWFLSADESPVQVLDCVWERSTAEATATSSPRCAP